MKQKAKAIGMLIVGVVVILLAFWHTDFFKPKPTLADVVTKTMKGTTGTYAIVIKNLKIQESYYSNEHKKLNSGSLYKLWVMAGIYEEIKKGNIQKDQILSQNIATLNKEFNIDPDSAELTSGGISLTISSAIQQMITISHNYAAMLLTEKLKVSRLADFINRNEFLETIVGGSSAPKTTARDVALFYEKLYKGEIVDKKYSKEMMEILKDQQLNGGLPKYLPKNVAVAHKTGDIGWFKHDGGIVFNKNGDYIIVVLSETNSPTSAQEQIAALSKAVYKYFQSQASD